MLYRCHMKGIVSVMDLQWAKEGGIPDFVLGAVDGMLYKNCPNKDEKALYWYMQFENPNLTQEST